MFNKIALTYNKIERGVIIISSGICILIALFGFLMGIAAIIFCDYGPVSECKKASLFIECRSVFLFLISILIIIAALRKEKPLTWYVRIFPLFPLILLILIFGK